MLACSFVSIRAMLMNLLFSIYFCIVAAVEEGVPLPSLRPPPELDMDDEDFNARALNSKVECCVCLDKVVNLGELVVCADAPGGRSLLESAIREGPRWLASPTAESLLHAGHLSCFLRWISNQGTCPKCRVSLESTVPLVLDLGRRWLLPWTYQAYLT